MDALFAICFIGTCVLWLVLIIVGCTKAHRKTQARAQAARNEIPRLQPLMAQLTQDFEQAMAADDYISRRWHEAWRKKGEDAARHASVTTVVEAQPAAVAQSVRMFLQCYDEGLQQLELHNGVVVGRKKQKHGRQLCSILGRDLNDQQLDAILHDDDRSLVVASAGSGKTTTIVGKVTHLILQKNVPAEKILLLAFTNNAASEMRERLTSLAGIETSSVAIHTFHSLGLHILGKVKGKRPSVVEDGDTKRIVVGEMKRLLNAKPEYKHLVADYFVLHSIPNRNDRSFDSWPQYEAYCRANRCVSLKGEQLKSMQEVRIANLFFCYGIDYRYEAEYEYDVGDAEHRQYCPDFFLPDYHLYVEHFAIDRNGNVPAFFNNRRGSGSEGYRRGIEWKRKTHDQYGTKLVESHSFEFDEGVFPSALLARLAEHGVKHSPRDPQAILEQAKRNDRQAVTYFVDLLLTFLKLARSGQAQTEVLMERARRQGFEGDRSLAFLRIFNPLRDAYEDWLHSREQVDFSDMIAEATTCVRDKQYEAPFDYVLVDEFQDISVARSELLKSLLDQRQNIKLYCVGDDWQSIFRFAGSDVSVMLDFEKHYGPHSQRKLEVTYRLSQDLAEQTAAFIMRNPRQISKDVKVHAPALFGGRHGRVYKRPRSRLRSILQELDASGKRGSHSRRRHVLLLGRYRNIEPPDMHELQAEFRNLELQFATIHGSKGMEADVVILDGVTAGGIPCEKADDPVLNLVLLEPSVQPYDEERRLFYVALTRSKSDVYLLTEKGNESCFLQELCLAEDNAQRTYYGKRCPSCRKGVMKITVNRQTKQKFWGCSEWPSCRHAEPMKR